MNIDPKNPPVDNGILTLPAPDDPAWLPGRRGWMLPYALVIVIVTTILLVMRVVTRINRSGGKLGIDDALIMASWCMCTAMVALVIYGKSLMKGQFERSLNY
jgi:hypothetical protein